MGRGLKVLFFGVFCYFSVFFPLASRPWKRLNSAIFRSFFAIFWSFFPLPLPEKNFAGALASTYYICIMYKNPGGPQPLCLPLPTPMRILVYDNIKFLLFTIS